MKASPADIRAAKEFLRKRGIRGVSPLKFAESAKETGMNYRSLLDYLAGVLRKKYGNYDGQRGDVRA
jgi:hypothetical protein